MQQDTNTILDLATTSYPSPLSEVNAHLSEDEKIEQIQYHYEKILSILGCDLTNDSLERTPHRVAKMLVKELFKGLSPKNFPSISLVENQFYSGQIISVTNIKVHSTCEHHLVPMIGTADVAYIPNKKVLGLSKINRIVDFFSRRPQVQERLGSQIFDCLSKLLQTPDIAIRLNLEHYCVILRGIQDTESKTSTQIMHGVFKEDPKRREELLTLWGQHFRS